MWHTALLAPVPAPDALVAEHVTAERGRPLVVASARGTEATRSAGGRVSESAVAWGAALGDASRGLSWHEAAVALRGRGRVHRRGVAPPTPRL
jgi:hypothetical protein